MSVWLIYSLTIILNRKNFRMSMMKFEIFSNLWIFESICIQRHRMVELICGFIVVALLLIALGLNLFISFLTLISKLWLFWLRNVIILIWLHLLTWLQLGTLYLSLKLKTLNLSLLHLVLFQNWKKWLGLILLMLILKLT